MYKQFLRLETLMEETGTQPQLAKHGPMRPGPSSCWPSYGVSAGEGGPTFGVRKQWILWEQTQANHWQAFLGCLAVLAVPWILKTSDFPYIFRVLPVCLPACCPRFVSSQFLKPTQNQRHWTCDSLRPSSSMAALMKPQWNKLGRMQSKKERLGIRKSKEFRESRHPWLPSGKLKIA